MVFARTSKAAARLSEKIRNGQMEKIYLAVVNGIPTKTKGRLVDYLLKDTEKNKVSVVSSGARGAKEAVLDYEVLSSKDNLSLVKIVLHTGRAHQIRVQLSNMGHPIYGDRKYGATGQGTDVALYAAKLSFTHPVGDNKLLTFKSYPVSQFPWDKFNLRLV